MNPREARRGGEGQERAERDDLRRRPAPIGARLRRHSPSLHRQGRQSEAAEPQPERQDGPPFFRRQDRRRRHGGHGAGGPGKPRPPRAGSLCGQGGGGCGWCPGPSGDRREHRGGGEQQPTGRRGAAIDEHQMLRVDGRPDGRDGRSLPQRRCLHQAALVPEEPCDCTASSRRSFRPAALSATCAPRDPSFGDSPPCALRAPMGSAPRAKPAGPPRPLSFTPSGAKPMATPRFLGDRSRDVS